MDRGHPTHPCVHNYPCAQPLREATERTGDIPLLALCLLILVSE